MPVFVLQPRFLVKRLKDTHQKRLLASQTPPCITIYVELLDLHEATRKYSELLHEAQNLLEQSNLDSLPSSFMQPLVGLKSEFPKLEGLEGIAIFRSRSTTGYIPLYARTRNEVIVGQSFHVEPILSLLQASQKYQVLVLGERTARLFLATQTSFEKIETFALEADLPEGAKPQSLHTSHGHWRLKAPRGTPEASREILYPRLQKKIGTGIKDSGRPLFLIGPAHLIESYRKTNPYPGTIESALLEDPDSMSDLGLHDQVEFLIREISSKDDFQLINRYLDRFEQDAATNALDQVASLAVQGRVETLLVERGRKIWGTFDRSTGRFEKHETQQDARDGDILDAISQVVVSKGGEVIVLGTYFMPSISPIAAILKPILSAA